MISISKQQSIWQRSRRYLSTVLWLVRSMLVTDGRGFITSIVSGVIKRISDIAVLIITLKCVVWLLNPETVPEFVSRSVPFDASSAHFAVALLLVPSSIAFMSAWVAKLHERAIIDLSMNCAETIVTRLVDAELAVDQPLDSKPSVLKKKSAMLARLCQSNQRLLIRTQRTLINMFVSLFALLAVVCLGLTINPVVTLSLISAAVVMSAVLIWFRHQSGRDIQARAGEVSERSKDRLLQLEGAIRHALSDPSQRHRVAEHIAQRQNEMVRDAQLSQVSQTNMRFALDLVQAGLLFLMMALLVQSAAEITPQKLAMVVILVMLLRFALTQIRVISTHAIRLSQDYPKLVNFTNVDVVSLARVRSE
jgi:ABC-type multidrug transport system fused ATPase/permease subunit